MTAIYIPSTVYRISILEMALMEIKDGFVKVITVKQNSKNMKNP